ncbi:MAG: hypothetical protein QXI93_03960, partial [Candidatus Methanomethylicia archaeon]
LNITIKNPRIIFQVPADIPITNYRWHPYKPEFKYIQRDGKYYVILTNITIPARSKMYFTIENIDDNDTPQIRFLNTPQNIDKNKWTKITVEALDNGWGIREVNIEYKTSEGTWQKAPMFDLVKKEQGKVIYDVWIPPISIDTTMTIKATVEDISGKSTETTTNIIVGQPKPKYTLKILSSPIEGITITINGTSINTPYTATLEQAKYTITIPQEITIAGKQYRFEKWSDGNTQNTRTITLNQDQTLTIHYTAIEPVQTPLTTYIAMIAIAIIVVIIIVIKRK